MTKRILIITGAVLVLVGILGFGVPQLFGMHLSSLHNAIHLVSGFLALYFGLKGTLSAARTFSAIFGGIYALLGLIGLMAGGAHGMWVLIPNQLAFGIPDHIVHLFLGGLLLFASCYKAVRISAPHVGP